MAILDVVAANSNGTPYDTVPPNVYGSGSRQNGGASTKIETTSLLDGVAVYSAEIYVDYIGGDTTVAKRLTKSKVADVNNFLKSGAAVPSIVRSIHKLEVLRTRRVATAIRENQFNEYTATFGAGYPVNAVDTLATDVAATPSRTLPGRLTFQFGSNLPVNDTYVGKTG